MKCDSLISIILPFYNAQKSIALAISSLLNQTINNYEIILIDDGSTDKSLAIASCFLDPRVRIIKNHVNQGLPYRLNQAIELSRGEYIARMDADDIAFPERFATQLQYMQNNPDIDLVGSSMLVFADNNQAVGRYTAPESHENICRRPWAGFYLPHPTWFGKRSFFEKYPYNVAAKKAQDQELLLRAFSTSRFANIPQVLLGYRQEKLSVKKSMVGRYIFSKSIASHFAQSGEYRKLVRGITGQLFKFTADTLVIGTGCGRFLYTHRADPAGLGADIIARWQTIMRDLDVKPCAA